MSEQYHVGDHVIYGTNGICVVEDICLRRLTPDMPERPYYILVQPQNRGMTIAVPTDSQALLSRMRPVLSRSDLDALLDAARDGSLPWIHERRDRAARFSEILYAGVQCELLLMIRCIYLRRKELAANGKKLNVADENAYKAAVRLVNEEFAYTLELPPDEIGDYIRSALGIKEETAG